MVKDLPISINGLVKYHNQQIYQWIIIVDY